MPIPAEPGLYWALLQAPDPAGGGEPTVVRYAPHDAQLYGAEYAISVLGNDLTFGADAVRIWGPRIDPPADLEAQARP